MIDAETVKTILSITAGFGSYSLIKRIISAFGVSKNPIMRCAEELGSIAIGLMVERQTRQEVDYIFDDIQRSIQQAKIAAENAKKSNTVNTEKSS